MASVLVATSCVKPPPGRPATTLLGGCTTCHADAADELAGTEHEQHGVGCVTCHGLSKKHVADKAGRVKPDRVFTRDTIDELCGGCHYASCDHAETTTRLPQGARRRTCVDCHGGHKARLVTEGEVSARKPATKTSR
jgi:hypothetical protein